MSLMPRADIQHRTKSENLYSYENEKEFLSDLQRVFEEDYDTIFVGTALEEVGKNVSNYLRSFL